MQGGSYTRAILDMCCVLRVRFDMRVMCGNAACTVQESTKMRELDLGYNEIKDDGACSLAQVGALGAGLQGCRVSFFSCACMSCMHYARAKAVCLGHSGSFKHARQLRASCACTLPLLLTCWVLLLLCPLLALPAGATRAMTAPACQHAPSCSPHAR